MVTKRAARKRYITIPTTKRQAMAIRRKVIAWLKEEPKRFFMPDLIVTKEEPGIESIFSDTSQPPCGTAACLAGAALILAGPERQTAFAEDAEKLLAINGTVFFYVRCWPEPFRSKYNEKNHGCLANVKLAEKVLMEAPVELGA